MASVPSEPFPETSEMIRQNPIVVGPPPQFAVAPGPIAPPAQYPPSQYASAPPATAPPRPVPPPYQPDQYQPAQYPPAQYPPSQYASAPPATAPPRPVPPPYQPPAPQARPPMPVVQPVAPNAGYPAVDDDDAPPIPMKIVVSGGFGVGKTTFVSAISDIPPLTTEAAMTSVAAGIDNRGEVTTKLTTTVAMDFGRVAVERSLVLYLFGTPGQDRFGFMWDDLVTGALGAVVLVDSRRLNDCFAALDYFEGRQIPFVVAVNQFDGRLSHQLDDVRAALALPSDVPVVAVDARHRDSVKQTILSLLDLLLNRAINQRRS